MSNSLTVMRNVATSLLQFFPLTVFLRVAFLHGTPQAADWLNAFLAGGAAAVLQFVAAYALRRGRPLNRLMMGVNAYLILGGAAVLTSQTEVLGLLNNLRESGIFLCLLAVGLATTFCTRAGFIGEADSPAADQIRRCSGWLLLLSCVATAASFYFRGHLTLSAVFPLVMLAVATRLFRRHLRRLSSQAAGAAS